MNAVDLVALAAKLATATKPNCLLDAELWDLVDPRPRVPLGGEPPLYKQEPGEEVMFDCAPEYTADLNLACHLMRRIFPGREVDLLLRPDLTACEVILWHPDDLADLPTPVSPKTVEAKGPAALALCCAIVKALIAEKQTTAVAA